MDRLSLLEKRAQLLRDKQYADASSLEIAYLDQHPLDVDFLQKAAWTFAALKKWDKAIEYQMRCIDQADFNPSLYDSLSKYQAAAGMLARAEETRASASRLVEEKLAEHRRTAKASIYAALQAALPSWGHTSERNPTPRFSSTLDNHVIDSAAGWSEGRQTLTKGEVVELDGVGKFVVGDPQQVVHKRLSCGVPWELPIAILLQELASRSDPNSLIVDVGANVGTITVPMALATKSRIIAFEPLVQNSADLIENLKLNGIENVSVERMACSDKSGAGEMVGVTAQNPGLAHLKETVTGNVPVVTLDEYLDGRPVGLIKMDAEGHEAKVLRGAAKAIAVSRPLILCELLSEYAAELQVLFAELGYRGFKVFRADWLFVPIETVKPATDENLLASASDAKARNEKAGGKLFSLFSRGEAKD